MLQSRIDYIFVSAACLVAFDMCANICAGIRSDHSLVDIAEKTVENQRRPGLWRYNNSLHESDPTFIESVKGEISQARAASQPYTVDVPIGVRVEMLLSNIRSISIRRSKAIAFALRKEEKEL